jgi:hypothetical protein
MDRDRTKYQVMRGSTPVKIADLTREELEMELMRALDVATVLEDRLLPLTRLLDDFITGKDKAVDTVLAAAEAE